MKKIAVIGAVVVAALGWFFVSPLFIDEAVDESFELITSGGTFDLDKVMTMPVTKREQMRDTIMMSASKAPDKTMSDEMPVGPVLLAQGSFSDADAIHKGSGKALVYELPNQSHVVRFEDFRTTNGPALVVYLAKHKAPTQASHITDGDFLKLGKLKGNVGNQNYTVPPGTNISEYNSVVIWCELFDVLFSPAPFLFVS